MKAFGDFEVVEAGTWVKLQVAVNHGEHDGAKSLDSGRHIGFLLGRTKLIDSAVTTRTVTFML